MNKAMAGALVVLAGMCGCTPDTEPDAALVKDETPVRKSAGLIPEVKPAVSRRAQRPLTAMEKPLAYDDEELVRFSEKDAKIYGAIRTALDENDLNGVMKAVGNVTTNADVAVRQEAVDALAWFGENMEALEQLQTFVDDPDAGVAADAFRRMEENTDLIEGDDNRNNFLLRSFYRRPENGQMIDFVCDKLREGPQNEAMMKTLIRLTTSGYPLAMARAQSAYKFITGETYVSSAKAMEWIKENGD